MKERQKIFLCHQAGGDSKENQRLENRYRVELQVLNLEKNLFPYTRMRILAQCLRGKHMGLGIYKQGLRLELGLGNAWIQLV